MNYEDEIDKAVASEKDKADHKKMEKIMKQILMKLVMMLSRKWWLDVVDATDDVNELNNVGGVAHEDEADV